MAGLNPLDSLQLRREIKAAENVGERWILMVGHEQGFELIGAEGLSLAVDDPTADRPSGWLLRDDPVHCWVATSAGLQLQKACGLCKSKDSTS